MRIVPGDKVLLSEHPLFPDESPAFVSGMLKGVIVTVADIYEHTHLSHATEIWFHIDEEGHVYSERWVDRNLTEEEENILPNIYLSFDELF